MPAHSYRPWLGAVFLVILLSGLVLAAVGLRIVGAVEKQTALPVPPPLVRVQTIEPQGGYARPVEFAGRVEARRHTLLGFEQGGLVAHVAVDEGQVFATGDVLAKQDTQRLKARRRELQAELGEARAALELARLTRDRTREAESAKAVSTQQWDEARQGFEARTRVVQRVRAVIERIDVDLEKALLRAPYAGVVVARHVDEGRVVGAGEPVLEILETGSPEARIGMTGRDAERLRVGEEAELRIGDRIVCGRVLSISSRRDQSVRTVDVRFVLSEVLGVGDAQGGIREGDLAVWIGSRFTDEPGVWLPRTALAENARGLWSCFVVEAGQSVAELRDLEVLVEEGERVYARGALKAGEQVVVEGRHRLSQGMEVRVQADRSER